MTRYLGTLAAAVTVFAMAAFELRDAEAQEWGALAHGQSSAGVTWTFGYGDSGEAAQRAAMSRCDRLIGDSCSVRRAFSRSCTAIAVTECSGECRVPAYGTAPGKTESEARAGAVAQCENAARRSLPEMAGTCRVRTGVQGEPGAVCVGGPRKARYGALLGRRGEQGWAFGFGDTYAAAVRDAQSRCGGNCYGPGDDDDFVTGDVTDGYFNNLEGSPTRCAAVALTPTGGWGILNGRTRSEAIARAISECERIGGGVCHLAAVECLGVE